MGDWNMTEKCTLESYGVEIAAQLSAVLKTQKSYQRHQDKGLRYDREVFTPIWRSNLRMHVLYNKFVKYLSKLQTVFFVLTHLNTKYLSCEISCTVLPVTVIPARQGDTPFTTPEG